jgi:hypothetical protein
MISRRAIIPAACKREVLMAHQRKRKNERFTFDAPVIYSIPNSKEPRKAHLKNYSWEGMLIEDSNRLKPDTHIFVKILKPLPQYGAIKDSLAFHAEIKWCHSKNVHNKRLYGMGIQHVNRLSYKNTPIYHCALCGEKIPYDQLLFVDDFLYLSPNCFDKFSKLDDGVLKKGIEDYMFGNVI